MPFFKQYEVILKQAIRGYETSHQLPDGTAAKAQVESSSAGIEGFAKYMDQELENSEYAQVEESKVNSDKPHLDLLTRVGTQSISVIGPTTE